MILFIFIAGAVFGSFLNVCIYRLPQKQSVVSPGSACPNCQTPIPFYYNLPLIGFLILKGKCHACGHKISFQYFAVELFVALISIFNYTQFGLHPAFIAYTILAYGLVVVTVIDIQTRLILNKVLITMLGLGLALNVFMPFIGWINALLGVVAGGAGMFLIAVLGNMLFKKESLGLGDVKLAAAVGFFIGWLHLLVAIYLGFLLAFVALLFMGRLNKKKADGYIPFGPFLSLAFMIFVYWGDTILHYYVIHFLR